MAKIHGEIQKKVLLLLLGGLALGLSRSPKQYWKIVKTIHKDWKKITDVALRQAIKKLYRSKLVDTKPEGKDGTWTLVLTEEGKRTALSYNIEKMRIKKPKKWDGKYRIVLFDIPERLRKIRDALRANLQNMEFFELQKSVLVHPFDCAKEIEYLIEFYAIRRYVRFIIAEKIDNEMHIRHHFKLL